MIDRCACNAPQGANATAADAAGDDLLYYSYLYLTWALDMGTPLCRWSVCTANVFCICLM